MSDTGGDLQLVLRELRKLTGHNVSIVYNECITLMKREAAKAADFQKMIEDLARQGEDLGIIKR